MDKFDQLTVALGSRSYDIRIGRGILEQVGEMIARLRPDARAAIVTDSNVGALYGRQVQDLLRPHLGEAAVITVQPGESSKSFGTLMEVVDGLIEAKLERGDLVLALGGGVIGDLAGFAAAICRRGMDFVQIPTSLLAQVDSSVGGKTGINVRQGKNLVGAFHQPILVIADTQVLQSLPPREFRAGYSEIVKYGLIDDAGFFNWLEENREEIFAFGPALDEAIAQSCSKKAEIVAADEREAGMRALLNLGHTFGHALEAACGYDTSRLVHGEAVAIGMVLAHEFSHRLGICEEAAARAVRKHLASCGLPTDIDAIPGGTPRAAELADYFFQDKKVSRGRLTMILSRGIGKAYVERDVPRQQVEDFLREKLRQ